jgi:2-dehydro-3-deoxyphosphogluconate aldolase/(4S)-4-hydroxy-2-oxoglutarate aldolase
VIAELERYKAIAIARAPTTDQARLGMEAAVDGGFRICEFTYGVPNAVELVREFAKRGGLAVGAGTVLTIEQARQAVDAGATFLVSPIVDEVILSEAARLGVPCLPGAATPTELVRAWRAGATVQKLFPAIQPEVVRAILAPLPFLRLVPTNGDLTNAAAHLAAGAVGVGFTRSLFDPPLLERADRVGIRARAEALLAALRGG